jgi:hypothetical protein
MFDDTQIRLTITRGFSSLVDKEATLAGYKNKLIGIIDQLLIDRLAIVPIYIIKNFHSINPIHKNYFVVRSFVCEIYGSISII